MSNQIPVARAVVVGTLVFLAAARVVYFDVLADRFDQTVLILIGLAVGLYAIPWNRLSAFKAGGVELTLNLPQVSAAVDALGLNRLDNKRFRERIRVLAPLFPQVRGARVLWIDDKPHEVVAERRLLRSLGIDITPAISSTAAVELLGSDNDFDLIITDVQRAGESHRQTGGPMIHEGVNFIVALRLHADPVIRSLPVVFYAAYDWRRLVAFTQRAREAQPEPRICNTVDQLVPQVVQELAEARQHPIVVPSRKTPTHPEYGIEVAAP